MQVQVALHLTISHCPQWSVEMHISIGHGANVSLVGELTNQLLVFGEDAEMRLGAVVWQTGGQCSALCKIELVLPS